MREGLERKALDKYVNYQSKMIERSFEWGIKKDGLVIEDVFCRNGNLIITSVAGDEEGIPFPYRDENSSVNWLRL